MRWTRRVFATFLCLGIPVLLAQSPTPATTIHVPVRLVTAPTLVFSKEGRLIPGLQRADFRVLDNNRPQKVVLDTVSAPVSLALAVQVNRDVRQYVPFIAKAGAGFGGSLLANRAKRPLLRTATMYPWSNRWMRAISKPHSRSSPQMAGGLG